MKTIQYVALLMFLSLACSLTTPPSAPYTETEPINKSPTLPTLITPAVPSPTPTICFVSAHVLQLRECGGVSCTVKDWLDQGDALSVQQNVNGWYYVITPNAESGWVNSKYCGGK